MKNIKVTRSSIFLVCTQDDICANARGTEGHRVFTRAVDKAYTKFAVKLPIVNILRTAAASTKVLTSDKFYAATVTTVTMQRYYNNNNNK